MKITTGILSLLFALSFIPNAFAQETSVNVSTEVRANITLEERRQERMDEMQERREMMQENREVMEEKRSENTSQWMNNIKIRIDAHAEWMVKRLNAAVERLELLTNRIESRMGKIEEEGGDTTEAENFVAEAKLSIELAKEGIADIDETLEIALSKEKLRGAFSELRELIQSINKDLRDAHGSLIKAVTNLKGLRVGVSTDTEVEVE
jgi:phage protein D